MTLAWTSRGFGLTQVYPSLWGPFPTVNSQFKEHANLLWPAGGALPGAVSPPGGYLTVR